MYRWLAESLGNVSVKRKLGIGFGLVLLLTLLITFTGWTGMSGIISRGDKLGFISSLNELTKDLRPRVWTTKRAVANKVRAWSTTCSANSTAACKPRAA